MTTGSQAPDGGGRHGGLVCAAVIVAATAVLWLPNIILGEGVDGSDIKLSYHAFWAFELRWLARGVVPLWDPHVMSGMPMYAQSHGLFYPLHLLFPLLGLPSAFSVVLALHTLLAGLFTYRLARSLPLGRPGALLAALAFMLSNKLLAHVFAGHVTLIESVTWMPAILWAWTAWTRRGGAAPLLWGAAAAAMQVSIGFIQVVLYTDLLLGVFCLAQLVPCLARRELRAAVGHAGACGAIALGGAALAAFQLIPALSWSGHLVRGGSFDFATMCSMSPLDFLTALVPDLFGDGTTVTYWGKENFYWEMVFYPGIVVLPLAMSGAAGVWKEPRVRLLVWVLLGALLLSMGKHFFLFRLMYDHVPGFSVFRTHSRALVVATLALALLAGAGLDALLGRLARGERDRTAAVAFAALGAALLAALLVAAGLGAHGWQKMSGLYGAAALDPATAAAARRCVLTTCAFGAACASLAAAFLFAAPRAGRLRALAGPFLILLLAADLLYHGRHFVRPAPEGEHDFPGVFARGLRQRPPGSRVIMLAELEHLNAGRIHGFENAGGYEATGLRRYNRFVARVLGIDPDLPIVVMGIYSFAPQLMLLDVGAVLTRVTAPVPPGAFEEIARDAEYALYRVEGSPGRAWIADRAVRVADGERALDAVFSPAFDFRSTVVLEGEGEGAWEGEGDTPREAAPGGEGGARVISWRRPDPNRFTVEAESGRPAWLVISEIAYPGWRATVNGAAATVETADSILRAVRIPAGRSVVELAFRPPGLRAGIAVSCAALLCWVALMAVALLRRRAAGRGANAPAR